MRETQGNRAGRGHPFARVGLLMVSLFLGHDAFMAVEAGAMQRLAPGSTHQAASAHYNAERPAANESTKPAPMPNHSSANSTAD